MAKEARQEKIWQNCYEFKNRVSWISLSEYQAGIFPFSSFFLPFLTVFILGILLYFSLILVFYAIQIEHYFIERWMVPNTLHGLLIKCYDVLAIHIYVDKRLSCIKQWITKNFRKVPLSFNCKNSKNFQNLRNLV